MAKNSDKQLPGAFLICAGLFEICWAFTRAKIEVGGGFLALGALLIVVGIVMAFVNYKVARAMKVAAAGSSQSSNATP